MKQLTRPYSRYRTQIETPGQIAGCRLNMYKPNAGIVTADSGDIAGLSKQSLTYMTDVVTPGFAQRVTNGEIVNNPMSRVSTLYGSSSSAVGPEFDKTGEDLRWTCLGDGNRLLGFVEPSVGLIDTSNLAALAQTSALAGVKAPELYAGVALGELRKTLTLAVSPLRALSKLIANSANSYRRDLRLYGNKLNSVMKIKGHTKRHKRLVELKREMKDSRTRDKTNVYDLEFIPDMVLAYNLGWKPLLKDIDAFLHTIPEKSNPERVTSRASRSATQTRQFNGTSWDLTQGCVLAYTDLITETVTVRAGVLYENALDPRADFGTRLSDVPITAWELIPFSFLVDYAVNIGDYLEAILATSRANILAYYTKITVDVETVRTLTHGIPGPGWTVSRQPSGSLDVKYKAVSRDNSPFGASITHTPFTLVNRPPAQLQNVLSLFTKTLYGASIWKAR